MRASRDRFPLRILHPLPAAALTGALFAAAHLYSLAGFLAVCWSGFLWSLAYEKSRSLIPGMLSHAIANALAFSAMILEYRL